jgi:4-amino-4-deoxychorismate lyase
MLIAYWLNGHPIEHLSPLERGFAYGDGLFSTMAVIDGQVPLLELHWQRLQRGCLRLGINSDHMAQWQRDFSRFLLLYPNSIVKMIVTRGIGGRGYLPDAQSSANCYFYAYPAVAHASSYQHGIASGFLTGRLGINPMLAGLKHLNRLEQVLLRQELAQTVYPEALVCDVQGKVIEGVFSNVWLVKNGELFTPQLDEAGVEGVMRSHLLTLAGTLGLVVHTTILMPDDFISADEVFFCNSLYGIWPVQRLNGTILGDNPITQYLQQQLSYAR